MELYNLLKDYVIIRRTNSGNDYGMNKKGGFSKNNHVSIKWIKKNLTNEDILSLLNKEVIGVTMKKGRGFSYMKYFAVKRDKLCSHNKSYYTNKGAKRCVSCEKLLRDIPILSKRDMRNY